MKCLALQNKTLRLSYLAVSLFALPGLGQAATCSWDVVDEWNNGFKVEITITNQNEPAFSDWQLTWKFSDGSTLVNSWNATFSCNGSECSATPPSWQPVINEGQAYTFGFVANKGGASADTTMVISGDVCSDVPLSESNASQSDDWLLNAENSQLTYVSVKKEHTAEINSFTSPQDEPPAISGSIDENGEALLRIDLTDVATGVDIRNSRLQSLLFETLYLPDAWFSLQLGEDYLSQLQSGEVSQDTITGELSLHGIRLDVSAQVLVSKISATELSVSNIQPVIIDSKSFDMDAGIEALRVIANLTSIGEAVPVYFNLVFEKANSDNGPLLIPTAPAEPESLTANFNTDDLEAELTWQDNSTNESQFLVRRKPADGRWQTIAELSSNVTQLSEGLPDEGQYSYKVIALNDSVPSLATNTATVEVTQGNPIVRGQSIFMEQCAGCHGVNGEGVGSFPALNNEMDLSTMINTIVTSMPFGSPASCDQSCAEDVAAFIETLWVTELTCDTSLTPVSYGARQLKILTQQEYQNSVEDLMGIDYVVADGLSADNKIGFFSNNTHASFVPSSYSNFLLVAEEVAQWSAEQDFAPALSCAAIDLDCAQLMIDELAPKIFRRPLDANENSTWLSIANGSETNGDIQAGMQLALEGLLSSPQFLYRHELGEPNPENPSLDADAFELTSWEMATFLAYTFTGSTPDEILHEAAAKDELRDTANIIAQANRLAGQAEGILGQFIGSWLGTGELELSAKDTDVWPGFANLVPDMKQELNQTFAYVMLDDEESFNSLYAGNFTFLNQTLARHYGIDGVSGDEFRKVTTSDRGGILANGAFMSRWGEAVETSPILRSVRVRRRMMCQEQPDPPAGTFAAREAKLAELSEFLQDPETTNRMKYHRLTEDAPCTNCHTQYINPLGFGMEDFDTTGRVRSNDLQGNTIDANGELYAPERYSDIDQFLPFLGAKGLGQVLTGLDSAQSCLPKQMFRFVMGVGHQEIDPSNPDTSAMSEMEQAGYACEVEDLTDALMNESPRAMFERFGSLESVRYRKAWARD
ncbi:DUF1592 domain-containing protein [Planctobacterium marinum]|uniref:Cellulose-binding domain protein n=1 Tax=Planctobacterium marinum TaxID=1631968 RepID=A0AA48KUM1_9ALTE|nr:hypothetical protein MACH26_21110 [Planctobacterium marinum]